jgi:hypothetical protein
VLKKCRNVSLTSDNCEEKHKTIRRPTSFRRPGHSTNDFFRPSQKVVSCRLFYFSPPSSLAALQIVCFIPKRAKIVFEVSRGGNQVFWESQLIFGTFRSSVFADVCNGEKTFRQVEWP